MTPERFQQVVEAYGADPFAWPARERKRAKAFAARHPDSAGPILARAAELDALLARSVVGPADRELVGRILADAPGKAVRVPRFWRGIGLVGLSLGGALAGALTVALVLPVVPPADPGENTDIMITVFGELPLGGDEEAFHE